MALDEVKTRKALARHAAVLREVMSRFPRDQHDAVAAMLASAVIGSAIRMSANPRATFDALGKVAEAALSMAPVPEPGWQP